MSRVAVFGLGYVGSASAAALLRAGHEVVAIDPDDEVVRRVESGRAPVKEPGVGEVLVEEKRNGRLEVARTPSPVFKAHPDAVFVCVGTPASVMEPGAALGIDETPLEEIEQTLVDLAAEVDRLRVAVRTTVRPGTVDKIAEAVSVAASEADRPQPVVAHVPEFLREGHALEDVRNPISLVVGWSWPSSAAAPSEQSLLTALLQSMTADDAETPRPHVTDAQVAETMKLVRNAYNAARISFANEVGQLLPKAKAQEVMEWLRENRSKSSTGYLKPGLPFGGYCLPKDTRMLCHEAQKRGTPAALLRSITTSNISQVEQIAAHLDRQLPPGPTAVARPGFKADSTDTRLSPSVRIARSIAGGGREVFVCTQSADSLPQALAPVASPADAVHLGARSVVFGCRPPTPEDVRSIEKASESTYEAGPVEVLTVSSGLVEEARLVEGEDGPQVRTTPRAGRGVARR
jgi:GDP-mannose 6-dehydrogenase